MMPGGKEPYLALAARFAIHRLARLIAVAPRRQTLDAHLRPGHDGGMDPMRRGTLLVVNRGAHVSDRGASPSTGLFWSVGGF